MNLYGRRDLYSRDHARLVQCPNGRQFLQNASSTYLRTWVPTVLPPEDRSSRLGNIARAPAKEGTVTNTMAQAQLDSVDLIHRYEVGRELSETGRSWLITLQDSQGRTCVISRLRSSREGNGF